MDEMGMIKMVIFGRHALAAGCILTLLMATGCRSRSPEVFDGETLRGWHVRGDPNSSGWVIGVAAVRPESPRILTVYEGAGQLINVALYNNHSRDIYTARYFGDCRVELEFMIPQGANSGVLLMGRYEVQIADSNGVEPPDRYHTMGAITGVAAPRANAALAPARWQSLIVEFRAPRFDASGNKVEHARFLRVELNGRLLHEDVVVTRPTGPQGDPLNRTEEPTGPLMLQGTQGSVAFRRIVVRPLPQR
ncbi:MAG TPA: DUF1080 domain-containing protein [Phycisphaerales bacterium]|nr:DUF1080 domain-containing protein [Phycisphaerales bacterium]